jgi:hypothetical protein
MIENQLESNHFLLGRESMKKHLLHLGHCVFLDIPSYLQKEIEKYKRANTIFYYLNREVYKNEEV